jgi:hypothetical protein
MQDVAVPKLPKDLIIRSFRRAIAEHDVPTVPGGALATLPLIFRDAISKDRNWPFEHPIRSHLDDDEGADQSRMAAANAAARQQIYRLAWSYIRQAALQDGTGSLARYRDLMLFVVVPEVNGRAALIDIDKKV